MTFCMSLGCFPHDDVRWTVHTGESPWQGQLHGVWPVTQGLVCLGLTLGFNAQWLLPSQILCFVSGLMKQCSTTQRCPLLLLVFDLVLGPHPYPGVPDPPCFPLSVPVQWLCCPRPGRGLSAGTGKAGVRTAHPPHHGISGRWLEDTSKWGQVSHPHLGTWHHHLDIGWSWSKENR